MKKYITLICLLATISTYAQQPLNYFLPDSKYDETIPTPEEYLGWQVGEWHVSHDAMVGYMRALAAASPRVSIKEYARSYEERPLIYLKVTSAKNFENIEQIKTDHRALCNPEVSKSYDVGKIPVVVYQGYSIHGNEASGGNAALLYAYYLAASRDRQLEKMLDDVVILLDPCYNPDGFNRFASWVNHHKSQNMNGDNNAREYNEAWPRGRTNHYWFDLNRDWLPVQHPESQGRIRTFHEWKPNVLTDHHEMGKDATYFFQPGVPDRTNPFTPQKNQDLTKKIGTYHAAALDEIGSLYYSEESFDDFYYGKGSTYPDANGCVGILFEQASSRGHLQETANGLLSFPFTIRNQVATSFSSLKASYEMRKELLEFQREFYQTAIQEAKSTRTKAIALTSPHDHERLESLLDMLLMHQIEVYQSGADFNQNGVSFQKDETIIIPYEQAQHRLIKGMFEENTTFKDSLFYDISAWSFQHTFGLDHAKLEKVPSKGQRITNRDLFKTDAVEYSEYAYLFEWDEYYAPKALNSLLENGLRAKVAMEPLRTSNGRSFDVGTIMIPTQNQSLGLDAMYELMQKVSAETGVQIYDEDTGLTPTGIDFGSRSFANVEQPEVLILVDGNNGYDAGEVWHLLDTRYDMKITLGDMEHLSRFDMNRYNVVVMVDGSYSNISESGVAKLKSWLQAGGTIVAMKRAVTYLQSKGMAKITQKRADTSKKDKNQRRPYNMAGRDRGGDVIGGAIFNTEVDLTHPLLFGYNNTELPVFRRGTLFFDLPNNIYASPIVYTQAPLINGYISKKNLNTIKGSAGIVVNGVGQGTVICMADNPNFRAFWYGTNKIMANAVFFGGLISGSGKER